MLTCSDAQLAQLDKDLRRCLREWKVPGAAVGVVARDKVIFARGYGVLEMGRRAPVTERTRFFIGSCSKAFTATALGLLVDEGKLSWDTPLRACLPGFRLQDPVGTERTTVRDALSHRTGMPQHDWIWITAEDSREELCLRLRYLAPNRELRGAYQYNNVMYMLAGHVVEQLSGQTWEQFVAERILEPLGMTRTCVCAALQERDPELAAGHVVHGDGVVPWARLARCDRRLVIGPMNPGGGLVSDVLDMTQWLRLQMNGGEVGGRRLLSQAALKQIHSPQMVIPETPVDKELLDVSYGFGWRIQAYRGHRWISHGGRLAGYHTQMSFLDGERIGVVFLTNMESPPARVNIPQMIPLMIYDRLLGLEPVDWNARRRREVRAQEAEPPRPRERATPSTAPSHPLASYAGEYAHPGYGSLTVTATGGRLHLRYHRLGFPLRHHHYDEFRMRESLLVGESRHGGREFRVSFQLDRAGAVGAVAIDFEPAVADIVFARVGGA
jgi:CubicO group peptidase (beta-lactamase class C family)